MSFNKYYIPDPVDFAKFIKERGPKSTVSRKIEAIIGNPISIQMFDLAYEMVKSDSSDADVLEALSKKFPDYFNAEPN